MNEFPTFWWTRVALGGLAAAMLGPVARAQCTTAWSLVPVLGPAPGEGTSMVFDEAHGVCVLFDLGETWTFDGTSWSLVATTGPSARWEQAMAYDALRARVVLFGGHDGSAVLGDTWEWDGSTWTQLASGGPEARHGHGLAFRSLGGTTILFGGARGDGTLLDDTWDWNGSAWSPRMPLAAPGARAFAATAPWSASVVLVYGGFLDVALGEVAGDTWRIGSASWSLDHPCSIGGRARAAMACDSQRGRAVLFGGVEYDDGELSAETWEFDGGWHVAALTGPSARRSSSMAFDSARGRMVLFGGDTESGPSGETWEYVPLLLPQTPSSVTATEIRKGLASIEWTSDPLTVSSTLLERERWSGSAWIEATRAGIAPAGTTRQLDLPGTGAFRYRVRASSCAGESPWSADLAVVPASPGAPDVNLAAARHWASFSWADRSDFESAVEVQRERGLSAGGPWVETTIVATLAPDTTSFAERPGGTHWRYRLRATSVAGESSWTPWVVVRVR